MLKLRTLLLCNWLYYSLFGITLIIAVVFTNFYQYQSKYLPTTRNIKVTITNYQIDGDYLKIIGIGKEKININYRITSLKDKEKLSRKLAYGQKWQIKGTIEKPEKNTIPYTFNYLRYLYYQKTFYIFKADELHLIDQPRGLALIKKEIIKRVKKIKKGQAYLLAFIIGDKNLITDEVIESYQINNISHLFALSGTNVALFASIIVLILKKMHVAEEIRLIAISTFLLFYLYLTSGTPSIMRATVFFILILLNKYFYTEVKSINVLLLTGVICLLINPFYLYDLGFQYSFVTSFSLIYYQNYLAKYKNYVTKILMVSLIAFIFSIPITIANFYQVNFFGILLNVIFVPLVSYIIYPLSLLTVFFPFLQDIFNITVIFLEELSLYFSKMKYFLVIVPYCALPFFLGYYLVLLIKPKITIKKLLFIFIFLLIIKIRPLINSQTIIHFFDVGQGDSILIRSPHNKEIVLIDTGGKETFAKEKWQLKPESHTAGNNIVTFLRSQGIKAIDWLIISHGDKDHINEAINLVENFKVEKVIFNCGEFNELEQELIKVLDKKKIPYYSCIKELNIDDDKLYFLNNKDYGNENDNSIVIYTELNNYKFLFMGDAGVKVEEDLIEKYNLQDIDVLKVGHHGSKTSSSKTFINEINPKYSIISVGKNNRYGHPNDNVLENLKDSKIYRTAQDGSIMFKIKNNKLQIETCPP